MWCSQNDQILVASRSTSINEDIIDDALTKVLGWERAGQVQGINKGVSSTTMITSDGCKLKIW